MTRQEFAHQIAQYRHTVRSGSGLVTLDGGIKCVAPSFKFYGACAQDGTPTPEAPVPIKCNNSKWTMTGGGGTVDLSLLPGGGLYGIGEVRDEWDAATGKGIRRIGKVDLGTLTFNYVSQYHYYNSVRVPDMAVVASSTTVPNILCGLYTTTTAYSIWDDRNTDALNLVIGMENNGDAQAGRVWYKNLSYTSAAAFKAAMSGVYLYYELAEPVPFTATPQPIIEQSGFNRLSQTDGDIDDTEAEATFVQHS